MKKSIIKSKDSIIKDLLKEISKLKSEKNLFSDIMNHIPGHVYWLDLNNTYIGCNLEHAQKVGLNDKSDIVGKTNFDMPWRDKADIVNRTNDNVIKNDKHYSIKESSIINGVPSVYLSNKVPLKNSKNEIIGLLGISIDITEQENLQEELTIAKEKSEAANHAKTEFIANMSHDIRTPLTGVIGMSKMLEDNAKDLKQKEYAHWLGESGDSLLHMLNDVLDVISADNVNDSDLHEEPFKLNELLQDIYKLEHPSTIVKDIDLILSLDDKIPPCLDGDHTKLQRILLNLLGNAIKFTNKGSVTVKVSLLKENSKRAIIRFEVSDTGIGIEPELQDKVFDRFFRVSPSYKSIHTGHGVGLHIAQTYTHLLGGEIKLSSELNHGTTFTFDLSLKIGDVEQITKHPPKITANHKEHKKHSFSPLDIIEPMKDLPKDAPNILLIEDNDIALSILDSLVTKSLCKTTKALDGETGLNLAKNNNFDLIITDLGLPNLSGIELTSAIREDEALNNKSPIPIIGLTAHADSQIKNDCLDAGMNDVLNKPMDLKLFEMIKRSYLTRDNSVDKDTELNAPSTQEKLGRDLPDTEKELFELDDFVVFDVNLALKIIGDDESLLKSILQEFVDKTLPDDIKLINDAYSKKDWPGVEKLAHKIKGGVEYCGTVKLKYACQYLERYHKAGHTKYLEELYQQLLDVVDKTIPAVIDWLATY
ncbi:MAG: ATP-binding protein [Legionellaceae bacterium]|nr:ATP-binding protein [Legionellaceae bacterium]